MKKYFAFERSDGGIHIWVGALGVHIWRWRSKYARRVQFDWVPGVWED